MPPLGQRPIGTLSHVRLNGQPRLIFGVSANGLPTLVRQLLEDEGRWFR